MAIALTISPSSGSAGATAVTMTGAEHTGRADRTQAITVRSNSGGLSKSVSVRQLAAPGDGKVTKVIAGGETFDLSAFAGGDYPISLGYRGQVVEVVGVSNWDGFYDITTPLTGLQIADFYALNANGSKIPIDKRDEVGGYLPSVDIGAEYAYEFHLKIQVSENMGTTEKTLRFGLYASNVDSLAITQDRRDPLSVPSGFTLSDVSFTAAKPVYAGAESVMMRSGRSVQLYLALYASGGFTVSSDTKLGALGSPAPKLTAYTLNGSVSSSDAYSGVFPRFAALYGSGEVWLLPSANQSFTFKAGELVAVVSCAYISASGSGEVEEEYGFISSHYPTVQPGSSAAYFDRSTQLAMLRYNPYLSSDAQNGVGTGMGGGEYGGYLDVTNENQWIYGSPLMLGGGQFIGFLNSPGGLDYFGWSMDFSNVLGGEPFFDATASLLTTRDGSVSGFGSGDISFSSGVSGSIGGGVGGNTVYLSLYAMDKTFQPGDRLATLGSRLLPVMTVVGMFEYGAAVRIDRDGAVTYIGEQATDSVGAYVVYLTAS